jgi:hypothetical protein
MAGNEGAIDGFWAGGGFVNQYLASELGAMVVYAEERYYGATYLWSIVSSLGSRSPGRAFHAGEC